MSNANTALYDRVLDLIPDEDIIAIARHRAAGVLHLGRADQCICGWGAREYVSRTGADMDTDWYRRPTTTVRHTDGRRLFQALSGPWAGTLYKAHGGSVHDWTTLNWDAGLPENTADIMAAFERRYQKALESRGRAAAIETLIAETSNALVEETV